MLVIPGKESCNVNGVVGDGRNCGSRGGRGGRYNPGERNGAPRVEHGNPDITHIRH